MQRLLSLQKKREDSNHPLNDVKRRNDGERYCFDIWSNCSLQCSVLLFCFKIHHPGRISEVALQQKKFVLQLFLQSYLNSLRSEVNLSLVY